MSSELKKRLLSLYAKGLSTRDISKTLAEIYGFETSHETISAVTDKVIPLDSRLATTAFRAGIYYHLFRCASCQSA